MTGQVKKMVFLSLLVALGVAVGFVETMIPLPIPVPGARLGLSNVVVLTSLLVFGKKEGFLVAALKSVLLMLVTGNVMSFFYSFTGSIFSCLAMIGAISWLRPKISSIGVSLIGASFHNLGQVSVAAVIISNWRIFAYLPLLLLLGIFTGFFVGLGSNFIVDMMKKNKIYFKE